MTLILIVTLGVALHVTGSISVADGKDCFAVSSLLCLGAPLCALVRCNCSKVSVSLSALVFIAPLITLALNTPSVHCAQIIVFDTVWR
jgi:hypothetical protein